MDCFVHSGTPALSPCSACSRAACDRCLAYEIDGSPVCAACGARAAARARALGGAIFAFVGVAYLATLAIAYVVFRARPFVGALAAVAAFITGRALQTFISLPSVTLRDGEPADG